jgi:hypothetical protein
MVTMARTILTNLIDLVMRQIAPLRESREDPPDDSASERERFSFQLRMLEQGASELQRHIGRMDEILFKIKASSVTVWVALMGWSLTMKNVVLIPLALVSIIGFWLLEGFFRGLQARYFRSSLLVTNFLNDHATLDSSFKGRRLPPHLVYPMTLPESEFEKLRLYAKGLIAPSTAILYLFLVFINYLLWISVDLQPR